MTLRERIENDKLYQLLIKVKEKPEMFLGDADLNILHGWIIGYNLYKNLNSIKSDIDIFLQGLIIHSHFGMLQFPILIEVEDDLLACSYILLCCSFGYVNHILRY